MEEKQGTHSLLRTGPQYPYCLVDCGLHFVDSGCRQIITVKVCPKLSFRRVQSVPCTPNRNPCLTRQSVTPSVLNNIVLSPEGGPRVASYTNRTSLLRHPHPILPCLRVMSSSSPYTDQGLPSSQKNNLLYRRPCFNPPLERHSSDLWEVRKGSTVSCVFDPE